MWMMELPVPLVVKPCAFGVPKAVQFTLAPAGVGVMFTNACPPLQKDGVVVETSTMGTGSTFWKAWNMEPEQLPKTGVML